MWLLASRQRPRLARECIEACTVNGMTSAAILYVDDVEAGAYGEIALPANWTLHVAGRHGGLSTALQWCLATYPSERSYGWLADDMRPRTPRFDVILEELAGTCFMSQANDLWAFRRDPEGVRAGREPGAGMCWGGDLVRAVGWWALPATFQGGTDVAWTSLAHHLGRMRFAEGVVVEHQHWRTGKRLKDDLDTDMHDANGHGHTKRDVHRLYRWLRSPDFGRTVERARARCRDAR